MFAVVSESGLIEDVLPDIFRNESDPRSIDIDNIDDVKRWLKRGYTNITVENNYGILNFDDGDVDVLQNEFDASGANESLNDISDALIELGDMAATAEVNNDDIMDAIAELGNLVAELMEVLE